MLREATGALFVVAYVLCTGSGILGVSIALNALSDHGACTVWFSFVGAVLTIMAASVRKFEKVGWLSWGGFVSIYLAVFIVSQSICMKPPLWPSACTLQSTRSDVHGRRPSMTCNLQTYMDQS